MSRAASRPNCGPAAVAALAGLDVDLVMETYRHQWDLGPRWNGRSRLSRLVATAKLLGLILNPERGARGSLRTWVSSEAIPDRRYLIRVGDHFVALIDGKIIDQDGEDRLKDLGSKRVTHVYFVRS
jgi:hypothetical protein